MAAFATNRIRLAAALALVAALGTQPASAHDGEHLTLEGDLEVIQLDDFDRGRSERRYFLSEAQSGRRVELVFDAGAPSDLRTGQKVRLRGRPHGPRGVHADQVALLGDSGSSGGSGAVAAAPESHPAVALLVDLSDASASAQYTLSQIASALWTGARSVDGVFRAGSYDLVSFPFDADGNGSADAFGPFAIPYSAASCDYSQWAAAADQAAAASGVNLSLYRHRVYVLPRYDLLACGWAGLAQVGCGSWCRAWIAEGESPMVYAHELGHNVGMAHAGTDPENDGVVNSEYGDYSDPMGLSRDWHVFNAPHVDQMGWFGAYPGTIATVAASGVYDLRPMSVHPLSLGGLRALRIARPGGGYLYLSFRQRTGYDETLASAYVQGVNIHRYAGSGYALTGFVDSLATGESFEDDASGVSVTQLARASDGSYVTVEVAFGCVERAPSVVLSPASRTGLPGATLAYDVAVANQDGAGCAAASFDLAGAFPSGFSGSFGAAALSLAPGATGSTTLDLTAGAADGSFAFAVSATGPGGTGSGSGAAVVDGTGPSAATLTGAIQKKTQVKLAWSGASDGSGSGIASYQIHREGGSGPRDFTATTTSYVDGATISGTAYTYTVRAVDRAGNLGGASNALTITPGGSTGGGGSGGGRGGGKR
jgi:hypothetical protein